MRVSVGELSLHSYGISYINHPPLFFSETTAYSVDAPRGQNIVFDPRGAEGCCLSVPTWDTLQSRLHEPTGEPNSVVHLAGRTRLSAIAWTALAADESEPR